MIALGIITFNRPECLARSLRASLDLLDVDMISVHDDGSSFEHIREYDEIYSLYGQVGVQRSRVNQGIAVSKNALLEEMLDAGAHWCFLLEDDIEPVSPLAITGYVEACEEFEWGHLSFAHHGYWRDEPAREVNGSVSFYRHYVGAFSVYSREALKVCGLFDEGFRNAFDHVEHTVRLACAGYTEPRPWYAADATGSEEWLREIPSETTIHDAPSVEESQRYWREKYPETYDYLWGASVG